MKFKFWPFLVALVATLILLRLGFWQLERAEQKQQALLLLEQQGEVAVEQWVTTSNKVDLHSQRVVLRGTIEPQQIWLLDNKIHQGQVGYSVITEFRLKGLQQKVLVDWGWVKAPQARDLLPSIVLPENELQLTGLIKAQGFKQIVLKQTSESGWPRRIQAMQELDIQNGVIYADSGLVTGLIQTYKPVVMPPEKHMGYALQWFLLAIACVVVFILAGRKKETNNEN